MKVIRPVFHGTFDTARRTAQTISALGWLVVIVGGFGAILSFSTLQREGPLALIGVAVSALIAIVGFLQVAVGQGVRAAVDGADYARQSLKLQIAQAEGLEEIDLQNSRSYFQGQNTVNSLPEGFVQVSERADIPIYSNNSGQFWVNGNMFASLENARAYAGATARRQRTGT